MKKIFYVFWLLRTAYNVIRGIHDGIKKAPSDDDIKKVLTEKATGIAKAELLKREAQMMEEWEKANREHVDGE